MEAEEQGIGLDGVFRKMKERGEWGVLEMKECDIGVNGKCRTRLKDSGVVYRLKKCDIESG